MSRQSLAGAVSSMASRLAAARGGAHDRPFAPKYCRTRGCNQRFGHDDKCTGAPLGVRAPVESKHNARYGGHAQTRYQPRRTRRAARPSGVALASPVSRAGRAQRAELEQLPIPAWEPRSRQFTHPRHKRIQPRGTKS